MAPTFRGLAHDAYAQTGRDDGSFQCSDQFIADFKKRHGFSSRRFHMRRRNRHCRRTDIELWINEIKMLLAEIPHRRIVNCDETMWRVVPNGMLTWAPVASESVSVDLDVGGKDGITVLASVTADYEKLPVFLIAKGQTSRVEKTQLGTHEGCIATHSLSTWTTVDTFHEYLQWLRNTCTDPNPIHLILDSCSVHRSRETKTYAKELNIEVHFIPPGWTDEPQPLDRYVFGAMKSMCRRLFQRFCQCSDDGRVKTRDAVQFLIQCWDGLETRVIEKGWGISEDGLGEADDEDGDSGNEWEPMADGVLE
jgi:hypothetical protein